MKPRVVVLGEKPQGATWLMYLIDSGLFDIVAGVPRHGLKNVWWGGECFAEILKAHGIPIVTRRELYHIEYDIIWSLMYGFIIEGELIEKANVGLNLHESPLPRFRGCNGYSHAILEGETTYGTSFHILHAELDKGELIDQEVFGIDPDEIAKELYVRTMFVSDQLFRRNIPRVAKMDFRTTPLDTSNHPIRQRSSLMKLKQISEDELCDFPSVYRRTRALDFIPFEPCYFYHNGSKLYVFLNNSLGRFDHRQSLPAYSASESLLRLCERESAFIMLGMPREVVVMKDSVYRHHYPVFVGEYSWVEERS